MVDRYLPDEDELGDFHVASICFDLAQLPSLDDDTEVWTQFHSSLRDQLMHLLVEDFNRLQAILYVLDIDEMEASHAFTLHDPLLIADALTDEIIRRHEARMRSRARV